ncbi:hypothetical protein ABOD69_004370 [Escherichia coli]
MKQSTFPVIVSTTGHVFSVVRVTLCTICLKHEKTGEAYVVIFTDCHNIRDYKKGVVPVLGELYQEDVDLITGKVKRKGLYAPLLLKGETISI